MIPVTKESTWIMSATLVKTAPATAPAIPPQVAAAQDYLRFAESLRNPSPRWDGSAVESRDLLPREQTVYNSALDVLANYFSGENKYETFFDDAPTETQTVKAESSTPAYVG